MADKAKQDMIEKFIKVTGVDRDRARFYLESSAWNLELAMGSFYEGDPDDDDDLGGSGVPHEPSPEPTRPSARGKPTTSSRFATIGSMNQGQDSDSSEEEGQAFYAGGSERSGQQVLGPKKKKTNVVEDLFKSAREHGAEEVGSEEPQKPGKSSVFRGSGYRLGEEGEESQKFSGPPTAQQRRQVDCVLKLWKNGFSVDDGPLRDFKDPANKVFLDSISKGEVPQELIREAKGGEVNLNMEDHRTEDYVKPKVPVKAFTGEGNLLGSPAPSVVGAPKSPSKATSTAPSTGQSVIKVDESHPTTTIQIRLADGTRLVAKFNHSHTVEDIRRHITSYTHFYTCDQCRSNLTKVRSNKLLDLMTACRHRISRPQYQGASFVLQTTFPNRELTDESETIEKAKLQNAVVVQRSK